MASDDPRGIEIGGMFHPFWYDRDALTAAGCRGQYLSDEQKILLDTELPRPTLLRTILHESLHGIFTNSTLQAGGSRDHELEEMLEEKICTLLELELPRLFKANPWLAEVFN